MVVKENNLLDISVERIRNQFPCLKDIVYFNSGWTGPMPKCVYDAVNKSLQNQMEVGGSTKPGVTAQVVEIKNAKSNIAQFFSTSPKNICLTPNTTLGINLALNAYNWTSDDEIITTKDDHASVLIPLYNLKDRYGVKIKLIDVDFSDPISSFKKNISKNTKAAVFCHVFWTNGNALPLKEVIKGLREHGVVSIIDGAQSGGALDIKLDEISPDFYSVPGQKWLLGPVGTGFLYVNENLFNRRPPWPSILGYESSGDASDDGQYDLHCNWFPKKDAGVFEFGGLNNSLLCGLSSAMDFTTNIRKDLDIYKRIQILSEYLIQKLKENPDIEVLTKRLHTGLVSWRHKKLSSNKLVSKLWVEKKILIREIPNFDFCRASVHFFNTKEEINLLVESLKI